MLAYKFFSAISLYALKKLVYAFQAVRINISIGEDASRPENINRDGGGRTMRKLTECLIVLAFLLCAFTTAQAASEIDVSVPSAGEPCSNDLQCDPGEVCVNDICSAARPCTNDLQCDPGEVCVNDICSSTRPCTNDLQCDPGELCIDDICKEGECGNDEDCAEGLVCDNSASVCVECLTDSDCQEGLVCDNSASVCVECLTDSDCQEGEFCADNTCVQSDDCELIINPPRININKKNNPPWVRQKLKVKGNENFDPFSTILVDDPLFVWGNTIRQKMKKLAFIIQVTTDPMPDEGFYPIRVGNCIGKVELYDKQAAKAAE